MEKSQNPLAIWQGFLPPRTVIMGQHRPRTTEDSSPNLLTELESCSRCKLCHARKNIVIGEGNPHASLVFVGEAPGEQEDLQGRPFIGNSGQLLDRMIAAITLKREDVYLSNVIKCHPPGNRNPELDEINSCRPFLVHQLQLIQPRVIVALGKLAAQTLLETDTPIKQLRGTFYTHPAYGKAQVMPTFHPSYLLHNPAAKREAWNDLKKVARELGIQIP